MKPLRWRKLTFRQATEADVPALLALARDHLWGAEVYTAVKLSGAQPEIGSLWTGSDAKNRLRLAVYDNGAYITYLTRRGCIAARPPETGQEPGMFARPGRRDRLCRMVYRGGAVPFPSDARPLRGPALLAMYETVKEPGVRSEHTEKRYVFRARSVNAGLAETFGICEDGRLAATASVAAQNETAALIGDVYTVYQYRYQGYASRLTKACVAHARQRNLTPTLYCEKPLRKFYRKLGFVEASR